jgi:hypothetical protein
MIHARKSQILHHQDDYRLCEQWNNGRQRDDNRTYSTHAKKSLGLLFLHSRNRLSRCTAYRRSRTSMHNRTFF